MSTIIIATIVFGVIGLDIWYIAKSLVKHTGAVSCSSCSCCRNMDCCSYYRPDNCSGCCNDCPADCLEIKKIQ